MFKLIKRLLFCNRGKHNLDCVGSNHCEEYSQSVYRCRNCDYEITGVKIPNIHTIGKN